MIVLAVLAIVLILLFVAGWAALIRPSKSWDWPKDKRRDLSD